MTSSGRPRSRRKLAAPSCWSRRPRCVRSPLAITSSGSRRSISGASARWIGDSSREPTWRSEMWRIRLGNGGAEAIVLGVIDESSELFDDLYLGLRAGGALRKKRRGEPLTMEEEEALGRWEGLSRTRKAATVGAFAVGTFGLGFTLGGLVFGR